VSILWENESTVVKSTIKIVEDPGWCRSLLWYNLIYH